MHPLLTVAAAAAAPGLYALSLFAEVRGLHDWLVPGARWRTDAPHIVLTFDDGPDPDRTPRLLDALAENDAKAVFFVVGENAERYPALVRRIADEGHQLGNHSWSHRWMPRLPVRRIEQEIDRCQELISEITGAAPVFARPPYGQKDHRYYRVLRERNIVPVLWSKNLRDYYKTSADVLVKRLARVRPGTIVLCHDGDPLAPHTVVAVERWLKSHPPLGLLSPP